MKDECGATDYEATGLKSWYDVCTHLKIAMADEDKQDNQYAAHVESPSRATTMLQQPPLCKARTK